MPKKNEEDAIRITLRIVLFSSTIKMKEKLRKIAEMKTHMSFFRILPSKERRPNDVSAKLEIIRKLLIRDENKGGK